MVEVRQTVRFLTWLADLSDNQARGRILKRLDEAARGHPGESEEVGYGVSAMRIEHGPGYRLYFVDRGSELIVLSCGTGASSWDLKEAKALARKLR